MVIVSASIAVWFFYVQHQFEDMLWVHDGDWSFYEAALNGSSHYELPPALAWFTGNIGVHHVHHLASRIPFYRLPEVLRDHPQFASFGRLTFLQSLRCATLSLWNERQRRHRFANFTVRREPLSLADADHSDEKAWRNFMVRLSRMLRKTLTIGCRRASYRRKGPREGWIRAVGTVANQKR